MDSHSITQRGSWLWIPGSRFARPGTTAVVFVALCLFASLAFALDFPELTGRVVDQAGVMSPDSKSNIETKSKTLEDKSGIQLVVATVKSLQGSDIETYANQLARFWKLGEAKKNNGVLLLVAPNERKVRIEVGYGLEGTLTDALSSVIISSAIVPRFKNKDFSGGIERGVDGIIDVLSGDSAEWQPKINVRTESKAEDIDKLFPILFTALPDFLRLVFDPPRRRRPAARAGQPARPHHLPGRLGIVGLGGGAGALPAASAAGFPAAAAPSGAAELRGAGDAPAASELGRSLGAVARFAGRACARFSGFDRPSCRSGRHPLTGGTHRRCGAIERA